MFIVCNHHLLKINSLKQKSTNAVDVREGSFTVPYGFSLNNSETVKAVKWHFATFSNVSLEIFISNLLFLTCPSLQILGKTQTEVSPISGFFPYKRKLS